MSNFDDFCKRWQVTGSERRALAVYLAVYRAQRTIDALMKGDTL